MRSLDRRSQRLVMSYTALKAFGKTPAELGVSWDEVDPVWLDAMLALEAGYTAQQAAERKKAMGG